MLPVPPSSRFLLLCYVLVELFSALSLPEREVHDTNLAYRKFKNQNCPCVSSISHRSRQANVVRKGSLGCYAHIKTRMNHQ